MQISFDAVGSLQFNLFLTSRCFVVRRDLAARNVLVGTGLLVKVSDYGLSRNVTIGT